VHDVENEHYEKLLDKLELELDQYQAANAKLQAANAKLQAENEQLSYELHIAQDEVRSLEFRLHRG
jgi:cell division protein FtsB